MRIIFMGTPEFAVPSLDILIKSGFDVVAVITATDKYGGRGGKQLIQSAVKLHAQLHDIPVLQPPNLKSSAFVEELKSYKADLQIVVAFRMLPEIVWNMPPLGTYNLHGSLLPAYRGAAPIHWAVINGETTTGVTTFKLKQEIDTGDIALQRQMIIHPTDTTGTVHDKMMNLGAETILATVQAIQDKTLSLSDQDNSKVSKAPKLNTDNTRINWQAPMRQIYNQIRGLAPFPAAWTTIDGSQLKIYEALMQSAIHDLDPGSVLSDGKKYIKVAVDRGFIHIKALKLEGKRLMDTPTLLNGWTPGDKMV